MTRWVIGLGLVPVFLLLGGFGWFAATLPAPPVGPLAPAEGLAVLTGGASRIETALALMQEGHGRALLITGVHRQTRLAEILALAEVAPQDASERITLGHWARSTRGNALEITAWAKQRNIHTVRVVTARYHMRRALLELRRVAGAPKAVAHPVGSGRFADGSWWHDLASLRLVGLEYVKFLAAWAGLSYLAPMREADPA
jgi:uncharacterized SAM-binding protein YcdF (DUF218 family)